MYRPSDPPSHPHTNRLCARACVLTQGGGADSSSTSGKSGDIARRQATAGGTRDLAAAKLHLRGILKQCEPRFGESALYDEMKVLLEDVEALLAVSKAPADI